MNLKSVLYSGFYKVLRCFRLHDWNMFKVFDKGFGKWVWQDLVLFSAVNWWGYVKSV